MRFHLLIEDHWLLGHPRWLLWHAHRSLRHTDRLLWHAHFLLRYTHRLLHAIRLLRHPDRLRGVHHLRRSKWLTTSTAEVCLAIVPLLAPLANSVLGNERVPTPVTKVVKGSLGLLHLGQILPLSSPTGTPTGTSSICYFI